MSMENVIGGIGIISIFILMPIVMFLIARLGREDNYENYDYQVNNLKGEKMSKKIKFNNIKQFINILKDDENLVVIIDDIVASDYRIDFDNDIPIFYYSYYRGMIGMDCYFPLKIVIKTGNVWECEDIDGEKIKVQIMK